MRDGEDPGIRAWWSLARHEPLEKWKVFVMRTRRSALLILAVVIAMITPAAALAGNKTDGGPLDQIIADTQLYVRDSVINYVDAQVGPIAPAIEGRLVFIP